MKGHKPTKNQLFAPVTEASNRPSRRRVERENSAGRNGNSTLREATISPFRGIPSHAAGPEPTQPKTMRLTRQQLIQIEAHLSAEIMLFCKPSANIDFLTSNPDWQSLITLAARRPLRHAAESAASAARDHGPDPSAGAAGRRTGRRFHGTGWYLTEADSVCSPSMSLASPRKSFNDHPLYF
jgi:hypothetical protein